MFIFGIHRLNNNKIIIHFSMCNIAHFKEKRMINAIACLFYIGVIEGLYKSGHDIKRRQN